MASEVALLQFLDHLLSNLNWFLKLPQAEGFCTQVTSYRHTVRSCRLMRQAGRSENKSKVNRLNKPSLRFMLLHTGCFWSPTCLASSTQTWIYSEHTGRQHEKTSTPNLMTKGNPNHLHLEVLGVLKRSD